jgi:hypothetical protein
VSAAGAAAPETRPPCSALSLAAEEPVAATASRIEHWLLVEYAGYWPYDPLDAAVFAGGLREHLAGQLERLPRSRLFLVRRPSFRRDGRVRVVYGRTPEHGARFSLLELDSHAELAGLDLVAALADGGEAQAPGEPLAHPLVLVCTHGKRDACCARLGRDLCTQLHRRAEDDWIWQSSHVGGDRFAGNVVCLPEGLYFGRLDGDAVGTMLAEYEDGRIALDCYRGRSCHPFPVQAAELRVREETGMTGFHDLRFVSRERLGDGRWGVDFAAEVAGDVYRVEVALELGAEAYLTCKAAGPKRPRRYVARACERLGSS